MRVVWFLGATGSVGRATLARWQATEAPLRVYAIGRRAPGGNARFCHNDFSEEFLEQSLPEEPADTVVCALGSNYAHARSRAEFLWIDREVPRRIARVARSRGAKSFVLVSTFGAHRYAPMVFARARGLLEDDLAAMHFERLVVLRPSFIVDSEIGRVGIERAIMALVRFASPYIPALQRSSLAPTTVQAVSQRIIDAVG